MKPKAIDDFDYEYAVRSTSPSHGEKWQYVYSTIDLREFFKIWSSHDEKIAIGKNNPCEKILVLKEPNPYQNPFG